MSSYLYIVVAVVVALISVVAMGLFGGGNHMPVEGKVSSSPVPYDALSPSIHVLTILLPL